MNRPAHASHGIRWPSIELLLVVAAALCPAQAFAAGFRFHPPEGFVDLSPGAPEERFEGLPPEVAEEARVFQRGLYAAHPAADGFVERFVATFLPLGSPDPRQLLAQVAAVFERRPGYRVLEAGTVDVRGVACPRLVFDIEMPGERMRVLAYAFRGESEMALVVANAAPQEFGAWLPAFERSMKATEGAIEPKRHGNPTPFIAVTAALLGLGLVLWIRGRRSQAGGPPRNA